MVTHLNKNGMDSVVCEQLNSKNPSEYASFKLSFPIEMLNTIKKPELWPKGVKINRFFLKPRTRQKIT